MFASIDPSARTVVLVEGVSDQRALETLAARRGHDLASASVAIVAMGGSKNVRYAVDRFGPARVEAILETRGDLSTFRTMQRQPAQLGRPIEAQLRRFMGTKAGRKEAYAAHLVEALDLEDMPRPLDLLLRHLTAGDA